MSFYGGKLFRNILLDLRVNSVAMATDTPLFSAQLNFSRFFLSEYIWVTLQKKMTRKCHNFNLKFVQQLPKKT
jgi:hypothetical protein